MVTTPCKSGTTSCERTRIPSRSRPLQKRRRERAGVRHLEEFRLRDEPTYEIGAQINVSELFKEGDKVDVRGKSIGKGFQGAVKRYGFLAV